MAERMKMICTGGPYGDASSSYVVKLDKEYTVQEFVKMVLDEKPGEWGNFEITTDFRYTYTNRKDICGKKANLRYGTQTKRRRAYFVRRAGTGLMTTRDSRKTARSAGKNCPGG